MIIDFTVSNFRSIREPITLSMLATALKEKPSNTFISSYKSVNRVLKTAVIYGPNASGKSNILRAMQALQDFVVDSTDLKLNEEIIYYLPFKLDNEWKNKPTEFEIEFIAKNGIRYKYSTHFNKKEVLKESLIYYPKTQPANLFFREKGSEIKFGDSLQGSKKIIESQLLPNNLFLSKAANSNNEMMREIYLYFRDTLKFSRPNRTPPPGFPCFTTDACVDNNINITAEMIGNFLKVADTGIESLEIIESDRDISALNIPDDFPEELKNQIRESFKRQPKTFHNVYKDGKIVDTVAFNLGQESEGTIKLYNLSGQIIQALLEGHVLIVDELDNSLHPQMTSHIINIFHNKLLNKKNTQLIFATHDTTLLTPELFRRDQIWMSEKNQLGATSLYSLCEFDTSKVRSNIPFDRWYLSGRFGALPNFGDLDNWMEKCLDKG